METISSNDRKLMIAMSTLLGVDIECEISASIELINKYSEELDLYTSLLVLVNNLNSVPASDKSRMVYYVIKIIERDVLGKKID